MMPMRPPNDPLTVRAHELLADGQWHDRDPILRELERLVPPGVAHRVNEAARRNASSSPVRARPITDQRAVTSGARRKALLALNRARRIERRVVDDVTQIRLRPMMPFGPRRQGPVDRVTGEPAEEG